MEVFMQDNSLPKHKLGLLGLQHVLVMYAGAVAVPLIIGRALKLSPEETAFLISADLFVCGLVTIIQSFGVGNLFGIRLPVMMGVTFAAVGPMVAFANITGGADGARAIFGAIIAAGLVCLVISPVVGRLVRFFPPVVTGSIILVIGISLMRIGINWIFGTPVGPTAPMVMNPDHAKFLTDLKAATLPEGLVIPEGLALSATVKNPIYAALDNVGIAAIVLLAILLINRYCSGFVKNISVLLGIVIGVVIAIILGKMSFGKVETAGWFGLITPFYFGMPTFDPIMILTLSLVMIVVMIESTGMFLALGEMTGEKVDHARLTKGLRVDGLGTIIGGLFNTFPYTSFSQNVGLVGVTGVKDRMVCVYGGIILVALGLIPKIGAIVESVPTFVLGGAGLVMFGMVAATGVRIISRVDFEKNRNNLLIVAVAVGVGMIPLIAPNFKQWMPHQIHPLIESGIVLSSILALVLNWFFNGAGETNQDEMKQASKDAGSAH